MNFKTNKTMLRGLLAAAVLGLFPLALQAQTSYLPAVTVGTAGGSNGLVSPGDADTYYCTTVATGCTASGTVDLWSGGYPPEILTLAHALHNNVDLIYEYVRNNIEITPMYGLQKGALGAIIDQSGTAFDQAQLMVDLLRASGYSAGYVQGTITLTGAQVQSWLSNVTDAASLINILADGGIPATVTPTSGPVSSATIAHIWVSVSINGTTYYFDPAFKPHNFAAPLLPNLGTSMGWSDNAVTGAAFSGSNFQTGHQSATPDSGSGTVSVPYVSGLNTTAMQAQYTTYANNLLNTIQAMSPAPQLDDLLGRHDILPKAPGALRQTSLPFPPNTTPGYATSHAWSGNIPDAYRTKFTTDVYLVSGGSQVVVVPARTFFTDEVYGRRMLYDISNTQWWPGTITLKVDDVPVPTAPGSSSSMSYTDNHYPDQRRYHVRLQIDHPYAALSGSYMDATTAIGNAFDQWPVNFVAPVNLVLGLGDVSPNLLGKISADKPHDSLFPESNFNCAGSETCSTNEVPLAQDFDMTEAKAAAGWLGEYTRMAQLQAQMASAVHQMHHTIGVSGINAWMQTFMKVNSYGQYDCPAICWALADAAQTLNLATSLSVNSRIGNSSDRAALAQSIPAAADALEGSIYEQQLDTATPASVSTRFGWGNGNEQVRFYLLSGATTSSQLFPIGPAQTFPVQGTTFASAYSLMQPYVQAGYFVIGAADAELGPGRFCSAYNDTFHSGFPTQQTCAPSLTRGGAFFAWNTAGVNQAPGVYQSIANIVTDSYGDGFKGGGAGSPPSYVNESLPSDSPDALKDKFSDRSKLLGVDLKTGQFSYSAPADISVGNGGFPYELSFQRSFKSGGAYSPGLGSGWTHNLDIRASMGSSGMEAMGQSLPANAVSSLVALYALQQILRPQTPALTDIPLLERMVLAPLTLNWWDSTILHNTVTITRGANAEQWVRLPNGNFNPPKGAKGTLVQTSAPTNIDPSSPYQSTYWAYGGVSFTYTSSHKDVQQFAYWMHKNHNPDYPYLYGAPHGWHLSSWTFPAGVTLSFTYQVGSNLTGGGSDGRSTIWNNDDLLTVSNNLGRTLTLSPNESSDWMAMYLTSVSDGQGRSATYTGSATTGAFINGESVLGSVTLPNGSTEMEKYDYLPTALGTATTRPLVYTLLRDAYSPSDTAYPKLLLGYDATNNVLTYQDATSIKYPSQRGAYQFFISGTRGERLDPLGYSYATYYDAFGRGVQFIDELGRTTSATYDGRDRALTRIFPEGDQEQFGYDNNNNVTSLKRIPSQATTPVVPASLTVSATYDSGCDKLRTFTDALTNTTTWSYDQTHCWLNSVSQPTVFDGPSQSQKIPLTSYGYNTYGQINALTDASGLQISYTYDPNTNYRHTRVVDPNGLGLTTTYGYDAYGDINAVTDPNSHATSYGYDLDRRVSFESAGSGSTCSYTKFGRDPDGDILSVSRDKDQTCTQQTWATKTTSYSPTKKPLIVTDEMGYAAVSRYDADDHATDATICLTTGAPGMANPLAPTCPGASRTSHTVFDAAGQTSAVYKGWGSADQITYARYSYGNDGEMLTTQDANNNLTSQVYDGYLRLWRTCFPDSTGACNGSPTDYEQLAYDNNGNLVTKQNRDGKLISSGFDVLNRENSQTVAANTQGHFQRTLTTSYDLAGRKWDITLTDTETGTSTSQTLRDRYDTAKRLKSVDDTLLQGLFNAGCTTGTSRCFGSVVSGLDLAGNRTGLTLYGAGGTTTYPETYAYDALDRMTTLSDSLATHAGYSPYDALGRPTAATWGNTSSTHWGFQDNDDLTSLSHTVGSATTAWGLSHDGSHQIIGETLSDNSLEMKTASTAVSYAVNSLNQYSTVGATTQGYDKDGNLTGDGTWTYEYDEENRLRKATGPHTVLYDYDPAGRRRSKSVDGVLTYYTSDGAEEIAEWAGSGALTTRYVNGTATDDHIAMLDYSGACATAPATPCRYYYHPDWHGSTVLLSNSANAVSSSYRYGPYGEDLSDALTGNPFRYTGRRLDAETGLYYYRARYYSPALGRFLQTDPIGSADDLDLYAYVKDDPLNRTDPTGNCDVVLCPLAAGLAAPVVLPVVATVAAVAAVGSAVNAAVTGNSPLPAVSDALSNGMTAMASMMSGSGNSGSNNTGNGGNQGSNNNGNNGKDDKPLQGGAAKKNGSYTNTHESGRQYHGKGTQERSQVSGRRVENETGDRHTATHWKSEASEREAFKAEAERIRADGGVGNPSNYNQINSPGENYLQQDGVPPP